MVRRRPRAAIRCLTSRECRTRSRNPCQIAQGSLEQSGAAGTGRRRVGSAAGGISRRLRHQRRAVAGPHREEGAATDRGGDQDPLPQGGAVDGSRWQARASSTSSSPPTGAPKSLKGILADGAAYGTSRAGQGKRILLEFVSANPTGPLVIVNARAAAVGDALARILRSQGHGVVCQFYVNDAGNQFQALARSVDVRLRQALGEAAELPENSYPGEYLVDLVAEWLAADPAGMRAMAALPKPRASSGSGGRRWRHGGGPAGVLEAYGTRFDRWAHEQADVRREAAARAGHRGAAGGRPHVRAGRRALVPLDVLRRRQGPCVAQVGRRADVLRRGHRLPSLRQVRRGRRGSSTSSDPTTTAISSA